MADYFGPKLKEAVKAGKVPVAQVDDAARRVLYAEFLSGIVDDQVQKSFPDVQKGLQTAQQIEEKSIVLLKNARGILLLQAAKAQTIAVIGGHADVGMLSGGGSAQSILPEEMRSCLPDRASRTGRITSGFPRLR